MKRLACIGTEYRTNSHVDVILTKFLEGCVVKAPLGGPDEVFAPQVGVASLYLDQFPERELGRAMAAKHNVPLFDTVAGALTLGTGRLAVDGVLVIGEHGNYPFNERGQHLYPQRRLFGEVMRVFERTGQVAPVFNDKHLSYSWEAAKWMYDTARRLRVPFMAGSSVPLAWRTRPLEVPIGANFEAALALGYGGLESYGFHTLEMLQAMIERRAGGEHGVRAVSLLHGEAVWRAGDRGVWSWDLLAAGLGCQLQPPARITDLRAEAPKRAIDPYAIVIEHRDRLRSVALMLNGLNHEFIFAAKLAGESRPHATQFWLQEPQPFGHFARLDRAIEQMILTGKPTYPVERTLLTSGVLARVMESKFVGHRRLETPELRLSYQAFR